LLFCACAGNPAGAVNRSSIPRTAPVASSGRTIPPPPTPLVRATCSFGAGISASKAEPIYLPPALSQATHAPALDNLRAWVDLLASERLAGRAAGSAEARGVAALLAAQLAASGWEPVLPSGDFCQPFDHKGISDQNVIARLSGASKPAAADTKLPY